MAKLVTIPSIEDERGSLNVLEELLPFEVKRIFYITNPKGERGGHRHLKTIQAIICLTGKCEIFINNGKDISKYNLDSKNECLILDPEDWHTMSKFEDNPILLVLSSEKFNQKDYIHKPY